MAESPILKLSFEKIKTTLETINVKRQESQIASAKLILYVSLQNK